SESVSAIFDNSELVRLGDLDDRVHLARLTVKMRWDYGASIGRYGCFDFGWIDIERLRIDIDEHGPKAQHARHFRNNPESQSGEYDFRTTGKLESFQDVIKRHAAI